MFFWQHHSFLDNKHDCRGHLCGQVSPRAERKKAQDGTIGGRGSGGEKATRTGRRQRKACHRNVHSE